MVQLLESLNQKVSPSLCEVLLIPNQSNHWPSLADVDLRRSKGTSSSEKMKYSNECPAYENTSNMIIFDKGSCVAVGIGISCACVR